MRPVLTGAALFAGGELLGGLLFGDLSLRGRADLAPFLTARPWLLIALVFAVRSRAPLIRYLLYLAALMVAVLGEFVLLERLGGGIDWLAGLRGLAAGLVFALVCDVLVQLGRRIGGWPGALLAALVAAAHPVALGPGWIDRIVYPRPAEPPNEFRPALALMTSLPIIWGGGDIEAVLGGGAGSSEAYRWLDRRFAMTPIDSLDDNILGAHRLLLLVQPRALAPAELVAFDAWVREGGRALILTDPMLVWESDYALGDPRAPPPIGLLGPLLTHWGLALSDEGAPPLVVESMPGGAQLAMAVPGRLTTDGTSCALRDDGLIARCRIGSGDALIVADADLLDDRLWAGDGSGRIADNMVLVTGWLDSLGGIERGPIAQPIRWIAPGARLGPAFAWACLPIGLCLILAALIRRRAQVSPPK